MVTVVACLAGVALSHPASAATLSLTVPNGTYTQTFDTLATSGATNVLLPAGVEFVEAGTNANATYAAGTGSANAGDTYSFGAAGSTDRAFGGLRSGALVPTVGLNFTNDTGSPITGLTVGYTGEQYRYGGRSGTTPDRLEFQYSTTASSLGATTGFVAVDALNFNSPVPGGPGATALDGNDPANRQVLGPVSLSQSLSIPVGGRFFVRFLDFAVAGNNDGLAVDDFVLQIANAAATPVPEPLAALGGSAALAATLLPRRRPVA